MIVGIDLGTTNSLVAVARDGKPEILKTREGRNLLPSVVTFREEGPVVGYAARGARITDAEHTVFSAKRLLGRGFADLADVRGSLPYRILPGEGAARIQMGDRVFTAIEISAMILRELKLGAQDALGESVAQAVVTVPAYFNDSQRQATRAAARLAGLDVLRIINEPTAASLAYGLDRKKQGLIAVYDLGGGTFDVSVLRLHDGIFEVLATHGDTGLGGDDFDRRATELMAAEIQAKHSFSVQSDARALAALLDAAEGAKHALSESTRAEVRLALPGGAIYERTWTEAEYRAQVLAPLLERTREPCLNALRDAGLKREDLSDVILVGGPTRLRAVQEMAREIFGREPNTSVHPDEVVAAGAAIQADILAGNNRELLLLDVVPLSLGIETYGGVMSVLIPRNTRIPTVARETFTTFVEGQNAVDVHVLQGERDRVEDNRSLARFKLKGITPQPAGIPRIEVTFLIDADGILQVAAKDVKTGNEQAIEVRPSYGLSDAEVEAMLQSGAQHAADDVRFRQLVEARNSAEPILRAAEKRLPDARRLLNREELAKIVTRLEELKRELAGTETPKIQEAARKLDQATAHLADLLVKEAVLCRK